MALSRTLANTCCSFSLSALHGRAADVVARHVHLGGVELGAQLGQRRVDDRGQVDAVELVVLFLGEAQQVRDAALDAVELVERHLGVLDVLHRGRVLAHLLDQALGGGDRDCGSRARWSTTARRCWPASRSASRPSRAAPRARWRARSSARCSSRRPNTRHVVREDADAPAERRPEEPRVARGHEVDQRQQRDDPEIASSGGRRSRSLPWRACGRDRASFVSVVAALALAAAAVAAAAAACTGGVKRTPQRRSARSRVSLPAALLALQLVLELLRPLLRPHALPVGAARPCGGAAPSTRHSTSWLGFAVSALLEVAFHVAEHGDRDDESEDGEQRASYLARLTPAATSCAWASFGGLSRATRVQVAARTARSPPPRSRAVRRSETTGSARC